MLIGGRRKSRIHFEGISGNCPHCGNSKLSVQIFIKSGHVFWIPFIPLGKSTYLYCEHCKLVLEEDKIPAEFAGQAEQIANGTKTPKWTFAGLGLFVFLIFFAIIAGSVINSAGNKEQDDYYAHPKVGDMYDGMTLFNDGYVVYKLVAYKPNEYKFLMSEYAAETILGLTNIKSKNQYSNDTLLMDSSTVKEYRKNGTFLGVHR